MHVFEQYGYESHALKIYERPSSPLFRLRPHSARPHGPGVQRHLPVLARREARLPISLLPGADLRALEP